MLKAIKWKSPRYGNGTNELLLVKARSDDGVLILRVIKGSERALHKDPAEYNTWYRAGRQ